MQLSHFEGSELISRLNDFRRFVPYFIEALTIFCPFRFAEGAAISITLNLAKAITISQKIPLASSETSLSIAVSSEKPWTPSSSKDIGRKPC